MGLDVYIDNQIHEREHAGSEAGKIITSLKPMAEEGGRLRDIWPYGDTMFHAGQMERLIKELERIRTKHPEATQGVNHLINLLTRAIKLRGYLWIEGD